MRSLSQCSYRVSGATALLASAMCVIAGTAASDILRPGDDWDILEVPDRRPAHFQFVAPNSLQIETQTAVGFLYRPLMLGGKVRSPQLTWTWRVDQDIPAQDQSVAGADDRPLAVHLWFHSRSSSRSMLGGFAEFLGYPEVSHILTYVWGGTHHRNSVLDNPYFEGGRIIILQNGASPLGVWLPEQRDLAKDLEQSFGQGVAPDDLRYIAFSADTDDRGGHSFGQIADVRFANNDGAR